MKTLKYPVVEAVLRESCAIQAWCVDDLVRSLKDIESSLRKIEMTTVKEGDWIRRAEQKRQVTDLHVQFKKLTEQLNRLLGVSF